MIVRIGAQDQEISAALEKLIGNAKRADADLSKLGSSPLGQAAIKSTEELAEKIKNITDAQQRFAEKAVNAAVGIETIGGASKLMSGQLDEVARTINKGLDAFRALGQDAPKDLQRVADAVAAQQQSLKGLGDTTEKTGVSFGTLVASYVSGQAIIGAVKDVYRAFTGEITGSIKAANEAEKAHVQLVAALRAQGTAVPTVIQAFGGYADALQRTTIYQDDAIEASQALLVQVGNVMPRDMEKALKAVTNLASGLGVDLTTATLQVAKAAEGNTAGLRKAGVAIDETRAKSEGFGYVLDEINKKFAGQAEAIAGTYQGRLTQLANSWNNVEESIGRVITQNATVLAAFDALNNVIAGNTGELSENKALNEAVSDAVLGAVQAFSLAIKAVSLAGTEFHAFKVVVGDVVQAFDLLNLGAAKLERFKLKSSDILGIDERTTAQVHDIDQAIADLSARITARGVALQNDKAAEADWAKAGQDMSASLAALSTQLTATRGHTKVLADTTDTATNAWDRHTAAVGKAGESQKKFAEAIVELSSVGAGWEGTLNTIDGSVVEGIKYYLAAGVAQDKLATAYGLTAAQIKAVDAAMKAEKKSLDETIQSIDAFRKLGESAASAVAKGFQGQKEVLVNLGFAINPRIDPNFVGPLEEAIYKELEAHPLPPISAKQLFPQGVLAPDLSSVNAGKQLALHATSGIKDAFEDLGKDLPTILSHAFEGGGGLSGAIKSIATKMGADFAKELNDSIARNVQSGSNGITAAGVKSAGALGALSGIGTAASGGSAGQAIGAVGATAIGVGIASYTAATAAATASGVAATGAISGALALGAATAGIGIAAVGAFFALKKLFGASEESKINPLRQSFIDAAGGLDALNKHAHEVGLTLDDLLNAKNAQEYNAAISTLSNAFGVQAQHATDLSDAVGGIVTAAQGVGVSVPAFLQPALAKLIDMKGLTDDERDALKGLAATGPDFDALTQTALGLGISLEQLGPVFQQQQIDKTAHQYQDAFDQLTDAGGDVGGVLTGLSPKINTLLSDATKFGSSVPKTMQPMLEKMLALGLLTDDSGKKLDTLSGFNFDDSKSPLDKSIDKLASAIDALGKLLANLPSIATTAAGGIQGALDSVHPEIVVNVRYSDPGFDGGAPAVSTGGLVTASGIQRFAGGGRVLPFLGRGRGTDTVHALLTPGEIVLNADQQAAVAARMAGAGAGYDDSGMRGELNALRRQMADRDRRLPELVAMQVKAVIAKAS